MRICSFILAGAALAASALAEQKLGKPLTLTKSMAVGDVLANPAPLTGKTVQVKGKVSEVCQMAGCWMSLTGDGKALRIKVKDGEIEFPKDSIGKMAIAEGTLEKMELSREQMIARAKHEAEEQGRKFDPKSIKSGSTIYQIQGVGALLLD